MSAKPVSLPPMISFVAPSGTGKTTMVEKVIAKLIAEGISVGAIKHDAHRIELDTEGKDSWRLRRAGASTMLVSVNQILWMGDDDEGPGLDELAGLFFPMADVIVIEGWRSAGLPCVIVERPEAADATWDRPTGDRVLATVHPDEVDRAVGLVVDLIESARSA